MRYLLIFIILCCFSCNNERVLLLPEIEHAEIREILDVSPAYIFYDETQPDSTLLNRKNLIGTTNWLVNVDKRLTLRQAMPHIKLLQDKKRNAEVHKNENAKNYFTCNDTSISNLGFLEFTDIIYEFSKPVDKSINLSKTPSNDTSKLSLEINEENFVKLKSEINTIIEILEFSNSISEEMKITGFTIDLYFEENLSFQDYITVKSKLSKLETDKIIISANEFVY